MLRRSSDSLLKPRLNNRSAVRQARRRVINWQENSAKLTFIGDFLLIKVLWTW
jgi:hypothetical protein